MGPFCVCVAIAFCASFVSAVFVIDRFCAIVLFWSELFFVGRVLSAIQRNSDIYMSIESFMVEKICFLAEKSCKNIWRFREKVITLHSQFGRRPDENPKAGFSIAIEIL